MEDTREKPWFPARPAEPKNDGIQEFPECPPPTAKHPWSLRLPENPKPAGFRVLLAEDDSEMRALLGFYLGLGGCTVIECKDGLEMKGFVEAKPGIFNSRIDLIVSDIRMPGMSGLEFLKGLHEKGQHPPVILITAFGDAKTKRCSKQHGAIAVLDKPFTMEEFFETVTSVLPSFPFFSWKGI